MSFNGPPKREINTLKREHLSDPSLAITVCLDCYENEKIIKKLFFQKNALNVDFFDTEIEMNKKGNKNSGEYSFVISPLDERFKYTTELIICFSVIVSGIDKKTNKNISILTHQTPRTILEEHDEKKYFYDNLDESIQELKNRCIDRTIDVVIAGGKYDKFADILSRNEYDRSLKTIENIIKKTLGFAPIILEPNKNDIESFYAQDIYFDTENRNLYLFKTTHGNSQPFLSKELKKQQWYKKE